MMGRLTGRREVAEGTAAFTFELAEPFAFEPGQTCDFTLETPKYMDERGNARTFSIASSPGDLPRITITEETGFIDAAFVTRSVPEAGSAIAYAAGPAAFVAAMRGAVMHAGVDPDQIRTEEFPGY